MKKFAVIIGHNPTQKGAQAIEPIGKSEFDFNTELAGIMEAKATAFSIDLRVFHRPYVGPYRISGRSTGNYTQEIQQVYQQVDEWDADYSTELHFNSFSFTSYGTEVLSSGSEGSLRFAIISQAKMVALFGRDRIGNRGVKIRNKRGARGYLSLMSGRAPAIIVEPFFGSNRRDCQLMQDIGLEGLAINYLEAMQETAEA